jgi:hypothetical protein
MKNAGIVAIALVALVAATVGSAAGAAPKKVYYEKPYGQVAYKPKRIDFSDLTLTKIHWRHWNRKVAWGNGRGRENTCDPACAGGQIVHGTAHLKMYKRRTVHGRRMYTCLVGTVKAGGQKFPLEWPPGCKSGG